MKMIIKIFLEILPFILDLGNRLEKIYLTLEFFGAHNIAYYTLKYAPEADIFLY